ncbi:MAG TPA: hypothetical protein VJS15_02600 [Allosphingosinicella sp.]|nr:hypothetical protein [Allosphingosinicella sp.]
MTGDRDDDDEGGDGLCDYEYCLEDHELTPDNELPPATGGVEE